MKTAFIDLGMAWIVTIENIQIKALISWFSTELLNSELVQVVVQR